MKKIIVKSKIKGIYSVGGLLKFSEGEKHTELDEYSYIVVKQWYEDDNYLVKTKQLEIIFEEEPKVVPIKAVPVAKVEPKPVIIAPKTEEKKEKSDIGKYAQHKRTNTKRRPVKK
jgi:hypothetical protein